MIYRITYSLIDIPGPVFLHLSTLSTRGHTLLSWLQDGRLPAFILPICPQIVEPAVGSALWLPQLFQVGASRLGLTMYSLF